MQDFKSTRIIDGQEYVLKSEALQIFQTEHMEALQKATKAVQELSGAVGGLRVAVDGTVERAQNLSQGNKDMILG